MMEASYQTVIYTGKLGTALIPKVLSNMLTCVHIIAAGEVMMVGKKSLHMILFERHLQQK